jgi:enterochelin esterase-like enzyme
VVPHNAIPADLRGEYRIAYDGVELPDPLNPQQQVFPAGEDSFVTDDKDFLISLITLPAAPPQPWVMPRPGVAPGRLEHLRFPSKILSNERMLSVYIPAGFQPNADPYPLLILFDRWAYAEVMSAPTSLDNLIAFGAIPPIVAIMVSHINHEVRSLEMTCNPSYAEFLAQELVPWVREKYHGTDDPAHTIVSGMSLGGLIAAYAGLRHPEIFGKILCQSASFQWRPNSDTEMEWLCRQFAASPRLPLSFYLEAGSLEDVFDEHWGVSLRDANRHMRDLLQSKGYPVHYAEFSGGHLFPCWQGGFADGMIALLGSKG